MRRPGLYPYGEGVKALDRSVVRLSKPFNRTHLAHAIAEAIGLPANASLD